MLTDSELQAIQERAKNATPGPWLVVPSEGESDKCGRYHRDNYNNRVMIITPNCDIHAIIDCSANHTCIETMEQEDNATFIASARQDIPSLLSYIEELEAKLATPDISDADVINTSLSMRQQYELEQKIPKDLSKFKISITRKP